MIESLEIQSQVLTNQEQEELQLDKSFHSVVCNTPNFPPLYYFITQLPYKNIRFEVFFLFAETTPTNRKPNVKIR